MRARRWVLALGVLLPCFSPAAPPVREFQISGLVVSSRDGSPVAHCRITASAMPAKDLGSVHSADARRGGPGEAPGRGGPPMGGGRHGGGSTNPETTCDDSGRFTLTVSRAGSWLLNATARGFRGQSYDEHEGFNSAVVLTDAVPLFNLNFKLQPDSVLTGMVYDEAGEPVAQASVNAELVPERDPGSPPGAVRPHVAGVAQTDDLGRYEIGGLAPANYRLRVQARPWYSNSGNNFGIIINGGSQQQAALAAPALDPSLDLVFPTTWFPGVDDEISAQTIALAAGELRQADFHLTAIPSFHLKVPRPEPPPQNPAQNGRRTAVGRGNQEVVAMPQQQQPQPFTITRVSTDIGIGGNNQPVRAVASGGDWDFGGLTPGTYEVRMNGPNGRPTGEVRQIEVRAGSQAILSLDSARPTVPLTIKIEGLSDSEVSSVELVDTENGRRLVSTPERGRRGGPGGGPGGFDRPDRDNEDERNGDELAQELGQNGRTLNVAPHTYEVYVNGMGGAYLTGMTAVGAKAVGRTVTIDGAATLVLRVAKTHAALDGIAKVGGKPAEGAMVLLVPATLGAAGDLNAIQRDETNTDGTFLIDNIVPGRYILVAIDHGWDVKWRDPGTLAQYLLHGVPVDLRTVPKMHEEIVAAER